MGADVLMPFYEHVCVSIFLADSHRLSTQHSSKGGIFQLIDYFFGECILNVFCVYVIVY